MVLERTYKFQKLADAMPHLVWTAQNDGTVNYYNARVNNYAGIKKNSEGDWQWSPLIHPDDLENTIEKWTRSVNEKADYSCEHRVQMADGSYRWHLSRGTPAFDETGNILQWYGTATDIHELKKTQQELNQAVQARDAFLSMASHELKTPLTSLKLQTQIHDRLMTKGEKLSSEDISKLILVTNKQVSRLSRLVDDMLDITRIQTGKLSVNPKTRDICELIREVSLRIAPQLEAAKVSIELFLPPNPIFIPFDNFRMEQVLTNIMTNAIRYASGTPLKVRVENLESKVRISLKDGGPGISKENHEKIFQRFESVSTSQDASGLGLGLYIVRQIVNAHKGKIWVESEPGTGSTFVFELPKTNSD